MALVQGTPLLTYNLLQEDVKTRGTGLPNGGEEKLARCDWGRVVRGGGLASLQGFGAGTGRSLFVSLLTTPVI